MKIWHGGMRWSGSSRAWLGLFSTLPDERIYCGYELTWLRSTPETAAAEILAFCKSKRIQLGYVVAQPDIFPKLGEVGETVSETFARAGIPMRAGSKDREACWSRGRSWLALRNGAPSVLIHPDCKYLIRTLPTLVKSDTKPDDVDETPDEYPAMGLCLYAMSRPAPWRKVPEKREPHPFTKAALWKECRELQGEDSRRVVGWNRRRP